MPLREMHSQASRNIKLLQLGVRPSAPPRRQYMLESSGMREEVYLMHKRARKNDVMAWFVISL